MKQKDFLVIPDIAYPRKWLLFSTNSSTLMRVSDAVGKYFLLLKNGISEVQAIEHLVKTDKVSRSKLMADTSKLVKNKRVFPDKPLFPKFKNDGLDMLWLHMSHACNAACRYCYAGR